MGVYYLQPNGGNGVLPYISQVAFYGIRWGILSYSVFLLGLDENIVIPVGALQLQNNAYDGLYLQNKK